LVCLSSWQVPPGVRIETGVSAEKLGKITDAWCACRRIPRSPKIVEAQEQRAEMGHGKRAIDYGFAEALASAVAARGTPLRLTGKTRSVAQFNQRHAVLVDTSPKQTRSAGESFAQTSRFAKFIIHLSLKPAASALNTASSRLYPESAGLVGAQFAIS